VLPTQVETVIAALSPLLTDERRERIAQVVAARTRAVVPVLEHLVDPRNISAVLRSAEAFGVQDVHVIDPEGAFVVADSVARGGQRWLDVIRHQDAKSCVTQLHEQGYRVLVADVSGTLTPEDLRSMSKVAVVFGNEHDGVSAEMRDLADGTYTIPMRGFVESLNVSVANAITLQAAIDGRPGDLSAREQRCLLARFMMLSVERPVEVVSEYERRNA